MNGYYFGTVYYLIKIKTNRAYDLKASVILEPKHDFLEFRLFVESDDLPPGKIRDMVLLFAFAAIIAIHWIRTILGGSGMRMR